MQCGRRVGKTETLLYILYRYAASVPNRACYWFAPKAKQGAEIMWASNRLQSFILKKYIKKILKTERRIILFNDSFIKLDGSDEFEQYRGVQANLGVYDESKDFHPQFHSAFEPCLADTQGPLILAGTPPRNDVTPSEQLFLRLAEEARTRKDGFYREAKSNERIDPQWLEELARIEALFKARAIKDPNAWLEYLCEYEGKFVRGGPGMLIPHFDEERHVRPQSEILQHYRIRQRQHDCDYYVVADPSTAKPYAVSFWIHDVDEGRAACVDLIYARDQREKVTGEILRRVNEKAFAIYPNLAAWNYIYDEAELWFKNEIMHGHTDYGWRPTRKQLYRQRSTDQKPYLSVFDAGFRLNAITIAAECIDLIDEIKSYKKDENGNIPKAKDHGLDTSRYFIAESGFTPSDASQPFDSGDDTGTIREEGLKAPWAY